MAGVILTRTIRVHGTNGDVQVDSPFGSVHVQHDGKARPETAGMPVYPGAKLVEGNESATVDLSAAFGDKDLHVVAGKWETPDSLQQVRKFYENKFPDMSVIQHSGRVEMHSVDGDGKRVIVLRDRGSSTEISLASVGQPKAN